MSWLTKIVSTFGASGVKEVAEEIATPATQGLTAAPESVRVSEHAEEAEDENPIKQRRYFVKKGLYVDNEEERAAAARAVESNEEIVDRPPLELKALFPKLSLR